MSSQTFDRETLLDLVVNAIPLAMMAFFVVLFAVFNPFGADLANQAIQFSIVIITFGALFVLTYYSGRAISNAEAELEAQEADAAAETTEEAVEASEDEDADEDASALTGDDAN
jgi:Na+/pantothenate symporter